MIDWLTVRVPYAHNEPVTDGRIVAVTTNGEVEWESRRRKSVEGSYSSTVEVRSESSESLWISGNPSKFLQGHNLFGSNDFVALGSMFIRAVCRALELPVSGDDEARWLAGDFDVLRIDVAESFRLPRAADVDAWIRDAAHVVRGKHQAVSAYGGDTIYIGQRSRRISLKAYNKAKELIKHPLPKLIEKRAQLMDFAQGLLRVEVRLLAMELKKRSLNRGSAWTEQQCIDVLRERIERLEMPQKMKLTSHELSDLPPRLVAIVKLWESGVDLRAMYPRRSFYRYRRELRKNGIDISATPKGNGGAEVIPLLKVLEAQQVVAPPDWAAHTPLLACA